MANRASPHLAEYLNEYTSKSEERNTVKLRFLVFVVDPEK
jgi:hypothetical protein